MEPFDRLVIAPAARIFLIIEALCLVPCMYLTNIKKKIENEKNILL